MAEMFNAIVIGTGQAGPSLADRPDTEGLKVAVIERGKLGAPALPAAILHLRPLVGIVFVDATPLTPPVPYAF